MKNTALRNALVTLGSFIFVVTVVGAWTAPGGVPPDNNVSAPITIGADQIKSGALQVAALKSLGGIQTGNTTASCNATLAGSIRWTGTAFEGCNGSAWVAFGGSWAVPPPPTNQPCPEGVNLKPDMVAHASSCSNDNGTYNDDWNSAMGGISVNTAHGGLLNLGLLIGMGIYSSRLDVSYLCSNGTYVFQSCAITHTVPFLWY